MWFNGRHRRVGHLFQGRYRSELIEDVEGVGEVARYIHLNPVRTARLGLSKTDQARQKTLMARDPGGDLVSQRLGELADYYWSSWQVYSGREAGTDWLETSVVGAACGGRSRRDQRRALLEYTEAPLKEGRLASPWDRLVGGLVLGSEEFARQAIQGARANRDLQTSARRLERRQIRWSELVGLMEKERGKSWAELCGDWGDWGRDAAIFLAVRYGGYRLTEVIPNVAGLKYAAAAQGMTRFRQRLEQDAEVRRVFHKLRKQVSTV